MTISNSSVTDPPVHVNKTLKMERHLLISSQGGRTIVSIEALLRLEFLLRQPAARY